MDEETCFLMKIHLREERVSCVEDAEDRVKFADIVADVAIYRSRMKQQARRRERSQRVAAG